MVKKIKTQRRPNIFVNGGNLSHFRTPFDQYFFFCLSHGFARGGGSSGLQIKPREEPSLSKVGGGRSPGS
jgi:hypothetical protein